MQYLRAKNRKWQRNKSAPKYARIDEFSAQLFDAIYENNFELAKNLIDDGKVDVNIKDDSEDTPLIAVCKQTTIQTEDEAVKFINYLWQSGSKFNTSNDLGKTAMNYAESNGFKKIIHHLQYIRWTIMYDSLCDVGLI